ncbi:MAG: type I-E CRISPR-associated endoribonuclease Cas2 [Candidatus Methanomethylophilaceae archaeon]|nr:type I-E CRISPR-associated endoribonuclease Cas2 [Candidatus Methanomethylophilaceae archaeon]
MIVIVLSTCSPSLRGDLTKWLFEVSTNLYVGRVSARIRDRLWERTVSECGNTGKATMVFTTNNEQGFDLKVHNAGRTPCDIDGFRMLLRPMKPKTECTF